MYKQIEELVVRHIRAGTIKPGQPLPSYPWLSKTLGVADKTVRQAYGALQQAGVLVIQAGKGTFVAPREWSEGRGRPASSGVVGLILPANASGMEAEYPGRVLEGVVESAGETGWTVSVGEVAWAERIAEARFDGGVILLARPAEAIWRKIGVLPFPWVWAGAEPCGEDAASVALDGETAGREGAYKLVGVGHRRVGLLRSARDVTADAVERGVRHALGASGLAIDPTLVQRVEREAGETGLAAADALLTSDLTAVVVCGAALLAAFGEAAWRRGRAVPASVSVVAAVAVSGPFWVGGVAVEAAILNPVEVGRRAVRRLRELRLAPSGRAERVAPEWVRGQSVGPPPVGGGA